MAAEPSGDALAGDLIDALCVMRPDVKIAGVGGSEMARRGVVSAFDITELSVFGLFDGLKIIDLVHRRAEEISRAAAAFEADAVVLIDSWGFMLRAAWRLRAAIPDTPLIKYVAPQVFAARRERARVAADTFDHLLAIHPFDAPYFTKHGMDVTFVGNPVLERDLCGDGAGFRTRHAITTDEPVLLVLFGSRKSELIRLFPRFADAAHRLKARYPELKLVTTLAPAIADQAKNMIAAKPAFADLIIADGTERQDAFNAADVALACSGTVTLELARLGVPTVAAYRLGWLAWFAARFFLMKSKYISLVNIAADEMLIPECIQTRCRSSILADSVGKFLDDPDWRARLSRRLIKTTGHMRGEGDSPAHNAAKVVLKLARSRV